MVLRVVVMISKVILIDADGKPYLEVDNPKTSESKIDAVMMSAIIDAVLATARAMVDENEEISKISFKSFTIYADRASNGHLIVLILTKDEERYRKTLKKITSLIAKDTDMNLSDLRKAIIEIIEKSLSIGDVIKEWGEDLWS
ncbi:MAG: hypothetical protein ACP6IU_11230 [Candidatus Asgardarchaeia archaeon]